MATHDPEREQDQPRSRVKVARNSKGEPQFEVSVAEGAEAGELDRLRGIAVGQYQALERELGRPA